MRIVFQVVWLAWAINAMAQSVKYATDALGRLTRVVYADGSTIEYKYDSAGNRLTQVVSSPSVPLPNLGVDKNTLTFSAAAGQSAPSQIVVVTNGGGGTLQWNASSTASWLSVNPTTGTNNSPLTIAASAASLPAGTYNASIQIFASAANAPATIPVRLTVTGPSLNPTFSSSSVLSAAGFNPGLARGSIASIFGTSLADASTQAASIPLPRTLGNVQVNVDGVSAPLWYVGPGQINFQVPFEAPLQGQVSIVVMRNGSTSTPATVALVPYAPSIFTYERFPGLIDPVIVHAATNELVTSANPVVRGEYITAYGTGIGDLTSLPATGNISPKDPPATAKLTPTATIGGLNAPVSFAGLTPDAIGLAQFNIQVPNGLTASTAPIVVNFNGALSQPVNVPVAQPCSFTFDGDLEFSTDGILPSCHGFTYGGTVNEKTLFQAVGGALHLDSQNLPSAEIGAYSLNNGFDSTRDLSLETRLKVYPGTTFSANVFQVRDTRVVFDFGVSDTGIRINGVVQSATTTDGFHVYKLTSIHGSQSFVLSIDGAVKFTGGGITGTPGSSFFAFGEADISGSGKVDIDYIRYSN